MAYNIDADRSIANHGLKRVRQYWAENENEGTPFSGGFIYLKKKMKVNRSKLPATMTAEMSIRKTISITEPGKVVQSNRQFWSRTWWIRVSTLTLKFPVVTSSMKCLCGMRNPWITL